MPTENTSLKNTTPAGDSNTTNEMVFGKINTYQRTFLIVAGSLFALLVLIAVAGTSGGQHLQSSINGIAVGAGVLTDYQVDSVNLALTKNIVGLGAVPESIKGDEEVNGTSHGKKTRVLKHQKQKNSKKSKNQKGNKKPTTDISENDDEVEITCRDDCPCRFPRSYCCHSLCNCCGTTCWICSF